MDVTVRIGGREVFLAAQVNQWLTEYVIEQKSEFSS